MSEATDPGPRAARRKARGPDPTDHGRYSPGPWRVRFTDQYSAVGAHRDVQAADGTVVASVVGTGEQCACEPETVANLNLLVAAPGLLAVAEQILAAGYPLGMHHSDLVAAVRLAKGGAA